MCGGQTRRARCFRHVWLIGIPPKLAGVLLLSSGPTRDVWYYEQPLSEGRKHYSQTVPIQFKEFALLVNWWNAREESERVRRVPAAVLLANDCNLDRKNPSSKDDIPHLPPAQLAAGILKKEQRIAEFMSQAWPTLKLGGVMLHVERFERIPRLPSRRSVRLDPQAPRQGAYGKTVR